MQYTIRHVTRFIYDAPITESVMEARVQPRSEGPQRCVRFNLSTTPIARVRMYQDHDGNIVHHFNIPGRLSRLTVVADALVECSVPGSIPEALPPGAWERMDAATASGAFYELMHPSPFARPTLRLEEFARELNLERGEDPLVTVRRRQQRALRAFHLRARRAPASTRQSTTRSKRGRACARTSRTS